MSRARSTMQSTHAVWTGTALAQGIIVWKKHQDVEPAAFRLSPDPS